MQLRIFVLLLLFGWFSAVSQNSEIQAESYFKNGEFEKALIIYKNIVKENPYNYNHAYKLIEIYQQLEQYDEAEQLINKHLAIRKNPMMLVVLGYNYQLKNDLEKANKYYKDAIDFTNENPNYIYITARKFEEYSLLDKAISLYENGKILTPERDYSIQLARIYGDQGNVEAMFANYIEYIDFKPNYLNTIKRLISEFISENKDNENNRYLRRLLLKKLQQDPKAEWYDMLSWLYVQEKAYNKSFIQEKALYKRQPESLNRIIELAISARRDQDYDTAKSIFNFILETTQDPSTALTAHQYILEIDTENADDNMLMQIDKTYNNLFADFGISQLTLPLQLAYGRFLAFNLNDTKKASLFLKNSLKQNISKLNEAKIKLLLADILVLQEKFNEALIFYSQIQANLKNSTIAQEARFKVAKTSYYKGDFDWAESQLNILKSSTSQLIANDALNLKLLISDNKYEDSLQTALKLYAKADLYAFQNKTDDAITLLDKILEEHTDESIIDQTLFQQAKLYETKKEYLKAEANYLDIIKTYNEGIFIDDAHYYLAELYNSFLAKPEEAKHHYEKIIFDHQDSIYFIEARRKFRMLRGDSIN